MSGKPDESDVDLTVLHERIVAVIRERFGARLTTVGMYNPVDPDSESIKTPAVLLELAEMRPGGRATGGRTPMELVWTAHCVLSAQTENVQLEVRNFAAQLVRLIDGARWGLDFVERAADLEAFPGLFTPGEKGFESWLVSWKQTAHLGEAWELPVDGPALEVFLGESPHIGQDHEGNYRQVV